MSNNTLTLTSEIKKSLRPKNILSFTSVMFLCSVLSLLLLFAIDPIAISKGITLAVAYTAFMTGTTVGMLLGMIIIVTVGRFYAPKVMRYVDAPNEIETVKDGLIALGAFVTTIENTINAKRIASIFYNISERFKKAESRITRLEENERIYMEEIRRINIELTSEREARKRTQEELRVLKQKESAKKQEIGKNIQASDITENAKVTDLDDKFE